MVWSSGVARSSQWGIGGRGRSPQPPKSRRSGGETPSSRRFYCNFSL